MNKLIIFALFVFIALQGCAQKTRTEHVFLITLDGLRWQEVFGGADSTLIGDKDYVENPDELKELFWSVGAEERRMRLMPFFWSVIAEKGQLYGNRWKGSKVNTTNQMWFSYPGYNEILSGFADDSRIDSNDKVPNPNETVLEYINKQQDFQGKVAAFGSWDVFPFIINEERSGIPVNAGFEKSADQPLTEKEVFLNKLQDEIPSPWGSVRLDAFTHHFAMEYVKKHRPRLLYIAYGETDDFAHDGEYDQYLKSAHQTDQFIKELWQYIQSTEGYKDKTTMIITTDHGRGTEPKDTWKSHGTEINDADQIWIAALGPDTEPLGDNIKGQFYQNQIAATVARALGIEYKHAKSGKRITMITNK